MRNGPDKNPFKPVGDLLSRAAPASRNKHFLSYFVDILLVALLSYLVFLGGNAIVTRSEAYQSQYAKYEAEITYYQDMVVEAHLNEYLSREEHVLSDAEDLSVKMAITQVLRSYENDNPASPDFLENPLTKLQETYTGQFYQDCFVPTDFAHDYISRFFIEYVPEHNPNQELAYYGDLTPTAYVISYYKKNAANYDKLKFIYQTDGDALPCLRPSVAFDIYRYLVRDSGFTRDAYDSFVEFYSAMLSDSESRLFKAPSYQSGRYQAYLSSRDQITKMVDTTLVLSIVLASFLALALPQLVFRDGRTIGKILFRLGVIQADKSEVPWWKVLLRVLLASLSNVYLAFFLVLLPPFSGSSMLIYLPYLIFGSFDLTLFNLVLIAFAASSINGIFMLLTHEKRSLTDLAFQTVAVDVMLLDEPDYDERDEASV